MASIKQMVILRRRAGMTSKEFFDYHYQVHGNLSVGPTPESTPMAYYQTHFFDSVYSSSNNAQPSWGNHNDASELYFKNAEHLLANYNSNWTRTKTGPDGKNFGDESSTIAMFVEEEVLVDKGNMDDPLVQPIVATYYLQSLADLSTDDATALAKELNPMVQDAFGNCNQKIVVNARTKDECGLLQYFGGSGPTYDIAYQIYLDNEVQIPAFRAAQKQFEEDAQGLMKTNTTFVCFGVRAVVLDQGRGITFDEKRQPRLP